MQVVHEQQSPEKEPAARARAHARPEINTYAYEVQALNGRRQKGKVRATSEQQAQAILSSTGVELLHIRKQNEFFKFQIGPRRVKAKELIVFTRQLAVFAQAGVSMIDAFASIGSENASPNLQDVLREMSVDLTQGWPLSEAMAKHGSVFPVFYVNMVRAGEVTGNLSEVLENVADYLDRVEESKKAIKSALIYPAIIGVLSIVTIVIMVTFVLPKFMEFFKRLKAKLPLTTRMLIGLSDFLQDNWGPILLVLVAASAGMYAWMRTPSGRKAKDTVLLKTPVVKDMVRFAIVERFCHTMATMVRAGVPLATSFGVVIEITNNVVFKEALATVQEQMYQGFGMSRPIAQTALFPPLVPQMIRVGEDVGNLDSQLQRAAKFYADELTYKLKQFTGLFEPLMIVFMTVVIGFVALAVVQAMYGIYNQVQI